MKTTEYLWQGSWPARHRQQWRGWSQSRNEDDGEAVQEIQQKGRESGQVHMCQDWANWGWTSSQGDRRDGPAKEAATIRRRCPSEEQSFRPVSQKGPYVDGGERLRAQQEAG